MTNKLELILIFFSVICGVISAAYLYASADIFVNLLKRPIKYISAGMFIISIGVLLAAFLSYESQFGLNFTFRGIPLQAFFYLFYLAGSVLIAIGARQFTHKPTQKEKKTA
jgi:uncharacterized membrane protein